MVVVVVVENGFVDASDCNGLLRLMKDFILLLYFTLDAVGGNWEFFNAGH